MATFSYPEKPWVEGQIHTISGDRKLVYIGGVWKAYKMTVPFDQSASLSMVYPPIESEAEPNLDGSEIFWHKPSTGAVFIKIIQDETTRYWKEI